MREMDELVSEAMCRLSGGCCCHRDPEHCYSVLYLDTADQAIASIGRELESTGNPGFDDPVVLAVEIAKRFMAIRAADPKAP